MSGVGPSPTGRGVAEGRGEGEPTILFLKGPNLSDERQQILILHLSHPDLAAQTVAWALYDGSRPRSEPQMQSGDEEEPPYASVLDAMRDGWFVLQIPALPVFLRGYEHETGHLPYEYVLERRVPHNG
jgi:hypothetical protein